MDDKQLATWLLTALQQAPIPFSEVDAAHYVKSRLKEMVDGNLKLMPVGETPREPPTVEH